jgi:hypothetical protein
MKSHTKFTLTLVLGLLLSAVPLFAQTPSQGDQKKTTESTTESCCCCSGDSCDMKKKDDATMKHDMKGHTGDCCKMKQKDKNKKAA